MIKKISLILVIIFVWSSQVEGITIGFDTQEWACGYISPSYPISIDVLFNNNDFSRDSISFALRFYSPDGSITNLTHVNVGAFGSTQSIRLQNGFQPGGFFSEVNPLTEFSWDGALPDSICFKGSGGVGWPAGLGLQKYMTFVIQFDQYAEGQFCVDSTGFGDPCDWVFDNPTPHFAYPRCWNVHVMPNCAGPMWTNCPSQLTAKYGNAFSYYFQATTCMMDPITYSIESGPGVMQSYGSWTYTPTCVDVGKNIQLIVKAEADCSHFYDFCWVDLIVQPSMVPCYGCGDVKKDNIINILDITYLISYIYKTGPPPPLLYGGDLNHSGNINMLDITYLINFLYKKGPAPSCPEVKDDFPLKPGTWWRYERYDDLTLRFDTILVIVNDSGDFVYNFSSLIDTQSITINTDTLFAENMYPRKMYIFPLHVGAIWSDSIAPFIGTMDYEVGNQISLTVPAGTFSNAFPINSVWSCGDECSAERDEWFVPGVGMVKMGFREHDLIDGWHTYETWTLIEYYHAP